MKINTKYCKGCDKNKDLSDFGKLKSSKDGLKYKCKACINSENKLFYNLNLEQERKRSRDYRRSEIGKEKSNMYYFDNQKNIIIYKHQFYIDNKNLILDDLKRRRLINPLPFRQRSKNRKSLKKNNNNGQPITVDQWLLLLDNCNYCCSYCHRSEEQCGKLTQDHIVPLSKGRMHCIENITPACHSCNSSKGNKSLEEYLLFRNKVKA